MVPPAFMTYFTTMAAVGATLFGLIFVAVSISTGSVSSANASAERQAKVVASYIALLNPLVISLFALVPHQWIAAVILPVSLVGLLNTFAMTLSLLQEFPLSFEKIRHSLFIMANYFLYGYETYIAIRFFRSSIITFEFYGLADLLIVITIFGVIRAWELMGISQFRLVDWLISIRAAKKKEKGSNLHIKP